MTKKANNWLEVDKDGLRELQEGKPKRYIIRELIANAWDEKITTCKIDTTYKKGIATISVEDDSPDGFKDLTDSYTLYKHTDKRSNPKQRGRFNLGEKQVLALCRDARVESTKGTILFNKDNTRSYSSQHRDKGTKVIINLRMTKKDYEEILASLQTYLCPKDILTTINGQIIEYKEPFKTIYATLQTELESEGALRATQRKTEIDIHKVSGDCYLYEMQIPITKIDGLFSIDIQQKIPLNVDRETVSPAFLKRVYAEIVNTTYDEIPSEKSSENWVRQATTNETISKEALESITKKRFGDKVLVANPKDPNANDEALANGYRVIRSRELSSDEWLQLKQKSPVLSTTAKFGKTGRDAKSLSPTPEQAKVAEYAKKLHQRLNNMDLSVEFIRSFPISCSACYGDRKLTFNLSRLPSTFFEDPLKTTDLILHELGHEFGNHTEHRYHEALTRFAQELVLIALKEPDFFSEVTN